ncbi:hypothetical protein D3C78_1499450 [compost metagenome]
MVYVPTKVDTPVYVGFKVVTITTYFLPVDDTFHVTLTLSILAAYLIPAGLPLIHY